MLCFTLSSGRRIRGGYLGYLTIQISLYHYSIDNIGYNGVNKIMPAKDINQSKFKTIKTE